MAKRLKANPLLSREEQLAYADPSDPEKGPPVLRKKELEAPHHLKKSARIGVQFMGDLFHESIPSDFIREVMWVIQRCGWHTFLILTKRPGRMKDFLEGTPVLDNLWLGVSIEDQKTADERIPILLQAPAAHRWVSVEPILGPVNLNKDFGRQNMTWSSSPPPNYGAPTFDWVVCGAETGPKARPLHPDWVRSLRDAAGVPFFFKGWGEWYPNLFMSKELKYFEWGTLDIKGNWFSTATPWNGRQGGDSETNEYVMEKVGKKAAGRLLDGREWIETP
jgi:protein gp37